MPIIVKRGHLKQKAAASVIIRTLHEAKQELAAELEANLTQLKAVLETTQKIAKELEAVLKEAKAEPEREAATGRAQPSWVVAGRQESWKVPGVKAPGGHNAGPGGGEPPPWSPPDPESDREPAEPESWQLPEETAPRRQRSH